MSQPHSTKQSVPGIAVTFEEDGPSAAVSADSAEGKEDGSSEKEPESSQRCCCCFDVHVKMATLLVAGVSSFFIVSNFVAKICGYSEIGWNFELLFLIVDGAAVVSLFYGLCYENAAFLQPFVLLSIITLSLLLLLATYLATAMLDTNSYAGQALEMELNKRLSDAAKKFNLEFKFMISLATSLAFFMILFSIFIHFWFAYMTIKCAKYFRGRKCPKNNE